MLSFIKFERELKVNIPSFIGCKIPKISVWSMQGHKSRALSTTIRRKLKGLEYPMILVTGGTGFIGQELVKRLLNNGNRVRVLSRREADTPGELFIGDITKPESLTEAFRGVSTVYHLAALVDHFASKTVLEKVNVIGTTNVVDAAVKKGVSRFIHCSTVSAERGGGTTAYGKSKILAETALRSCGTGLSYVIIRPGPVYDAERRDLRKAVYFAKRFKIFGKILPDNMIHLASRTNVANGMLLAAERGAPGKAYTICDRKPVSRALLSQLICEKTRAFLLPLPLYMLYPVLYAVSGGVEILSHLIQKRLPLNRNYLRMLTRRRQYDISPAINELGYEPATTELHFSEAVDACLKYLSKNTVSEN